MKRVVTLRFLISHGILGLLKVSEVRVIVGSRRIMNDIKLQIVIPTKNEEEVIAEFLDSLKDYRCIVVDDSNDDTKKIAREKGATVLDGKGNESPSIKYALEQCEEYAVVLDCDGSHPISLIPEMIKALMNGADLVIGSRYTEGGSRGASRLVSEFGNIFSRFILGLKTRDLTGRFIVGHKNTLLDYCKWEGRGEDSIELTYAIEKRGLKIVEIPFTYEKRKGGKSKTNLVKYIVKYFRKTLEIKLDSFRLYDKSYIARAIRKNYVSQEYKDSLLGNIIYNLQIPPYLLLRFLLYVPLIHALIRDICVNYDRGIIGFYLRCVYWKSRLGFVGKNCFFDEGVSIFPNAKTVCIDDDCFLEKGCCIVSSDTEFRIGKNCHIGADSYINGKPFFRMGRYSCIDTGSKIFGSTNLPNDSDGNVMSFSCTSPERLQRLRYRGTKIGRNSFIGPNSVAVCSWIGDDVIIGSSSFVNSDIESGNVFAGSPAKFIRKSKLSR